MREGGEPVPVVGQQAVTEHEPAPLVALQVVGPFKEPALACVHTRQVEPRERRGRQPPHQLVHAASPFLSVGVSPGGTRRGPAQFLRSCRCRCRTAANANAKYR